ncbi:MAG: NAD(P)H-binding protein [Alphaproteobacteria bacterium]|nr:NAD(P)H-binding protein [Alphaproteobacteria bacterium]
MDRQRVLLLGATGTIGRATAAELVRRGADVVCLLRPGSAADVLPDGMTVRIGTLAGLELSGERFDAVVSCLASRTGVPADAWAVDHDANLAVLEAAKAAGVPQFILLSAICVQRPLLAFQRAKLAFEAALQASGLRWTIVRPTAFFKSLSGQIARVRRGQPFLVFGDGTLTACKPISDSDLARYIADCLTDDTRWNRILPIGGPGPAITPADQAAMLAELTGKPVRVRRVPVALLDAIVALLSALGKLVPALGAKAELAKIGRYYATESMLVFDHATGRYSAEATPETGSDTLRAHYARLLAGAADDDRGDHAVFR